MGISIKQWLNHYLSRIASMSQDSVRIRHHRYDGLVKWRVLQMMTLLPLLLQFALALFLIGLLELLWSVNTVVATITTILATTLLVFTVTTPILPAFDQNCPYKSPQAWWCFKLIQLIRESLTSPAQRLLSSLRVSRPFGISPLQYKTRQSIVKWLSALITVRNHANWRDYERVVVGSLAPRIDAEMLAVADMTVLDDNFLATIIRPCLGDLKLEAALRGCYTILKQRADRIVNDLPVWSSDQHNSQTIVTMGNIVLDVLCRVTYRDDDSDFHQKSLLHILGSLPYRTALPVYDYHRAFKTILRTLSQRESTLEVHRQCLILAEHFIRLRPDDAGPDGER